MHRNYDKESLVLCVIGMGLDNLEKKIGLKTRGIRKIITNFMIEKKIIYFSRIFKISHVFRIYIRVVKTMKEKCSIDMIKLVRI